MPTEQNKGLRGLPGLNSISDQERQAFLLNNADKLKQYRSPGKRKQAAEILYNNQQFINQFGQEAFDNMNDGTQASYDYRNNLLKDKVVNDAIIANYKPIIRNGRADLNTGAGDKWETISQLSTDAKLKLLNSDWLTPKQVEAKRGHYTGSDYWDEGIDFLAGEAIQRYRQDSNQKILDKIFSEDAENASKRYSAEVSQAYLDPAITGRNDAETKKKFYEAITPSAFNMGISEYAARYGNGSEEDMSSEMEDFSIEDMRQVLAKKAVYDANMTPQMASTALNDEAKRYIKSKQGRLKRLGLWAQDTGISAMSYTADKINGIYNLMLAGEDKLSDLGFGEAKPTVYVDDQGNVVDPRKNKIVRRKDGQLLYQDADGRTHTVHQEQFDRTTLHNMGKEMDGSDEEEGIFHLNPAYWTRAEQFGTLDKDLQKKYEKLGTSPYKVAYDPNEDSDLTYEAFKMMSFGLADGVSMFIPFGVGAAGRVLSTASKAGKVVRGVGKGLQFAGESLSAQSKFGQVAQGLAGAGGIAYAYQRGAFQETMAQNLANLDETVNNLSKRDVYNLYQSDENYRNQIDSLIDARAASLKADYIASLGENGQRQIVDENILNNRIRAKAQEEVLNEQVQNRIAERKASDEYGKLQQEAIQSAGDAAWTSFMPEAIKYGLVNTVGFRKWMYSNPSGLAKKVSPMFKGIKEVTTAEGKQRLATEGTKFATRGQKLKEFGKVLGSQVWGGAWTNGTDDMMVDAAERINEDSYRRYLHDYETGESTADLYGFADGLYSYWKGLQNSMGQDTTWNAALVGGFGSVVSATPNFANIAHYATKEGRKAFRDNFQQRNVYETDEQGNRWIKRDEEGNPVKENLKFFDNPGERLSFFLQNGVLNTYYGKQQAERDAQSHADYVNQLLDDNGDFDVLNDLMASDIAVDNATNLRDQKTSRFIKAINTVAALEKLGKNSNDPTTLSSVVESRRDLTDRVASLAEEGNEGAVSEQEMKDLLENYYHQHPSVEQSDENNQIALQNIIKNAQKLKEASEAYQKAEDDIQKVEKSMGSSFSPLVRGRMKLNAALDGHWKDRLQTMKDEIGDASSADTDVTGVDLIATFGGKKKAENILKVYDAQELELKENIADQLNDVHTALENYNKAQQALREAKTSDDRFSAEKEVIRTKAEYENAVQEKMILDDELSFTKEKKNTLKSALNDWEKGDSKVLTADEIMALDPVTRARMMHEKNREGYSKQQQRNIKKLEEKLQRTDPDALQKIQDIAVLTMQIAQNDDAYNRMAKNPDAAEVKLEKQKKIAADKAYDLINKRNAETLVNTINSIEDGLKAHNDVSKEFKDNFAFRLLRRYNPTLLDIIEKEKMLPEHQKELSEAKEWSKVTTDIDNVISAIDENDDVKKSIYRSINNIVEKSNSKQEIIDNLEQAIDDISDEDVTSDIERVLSGLEKLGYQRDATVVEDRKAAKARAEAARKKMEEDKARAEARAKEAAEKAAQEAAEKAKAASTPQAAGDAVEAKQNGELNDLSAALGLSSENTDTKKESTDSEKEFNEKVSKLKEDVAKNTRTGMRGWTNVTIVNRDYNGAPHINIGTYNSGEDWQTSSDYRLNDKGQVEAKFEDKDWQIIENPSDYIKEFFDGFRKTTAEQQPTEQIITTTATSKSGKKVNGSYTTNKDADGFIHIKRSSGPSIAQRKVTPSEMQEIGINENDVLGNREDYNDPSNYDKLKEIYDTEGFRIEDLTIRPNGTVAVNHNEDYFELSGDKAQKFLDKVFPELNSITKQSVQQKEESSVKEDVEEDIKKKWFGTQEISEEAAKLKEDGDNYVAETPTAEEEAASLDSEEVTIINDTEQLEDSETTNEQGLEAIDTKDNLLSGNPMEEYAQDSLKKHILIRKKGRKANDPMEQYFAWMDNEKIKLQEIIDDELHEILSRNEEDERPTKVKFMAVRRKNNATNDIAMKNHLMLVLDYTSTVDEVHKKERGGVIETNGKKYLVIGEVGYGKDTKENAERKRLRDVLYNPSMGKGYGIAIEGMGEFFEKHPEEQFYVNDAISTEIVPNSLIPGWLVKQMKEDEGTEYRPISVLLKDEEGVGRNPHQLTMEDLGWYIQETTKPVIVNNQGLNVMQPQDVDSNTGRVFVLIPAANGKLVPSYIRPITYPEIVGDERFANSKLRQRIDEDLMKLTSPPSKENLSAKKEALRDLMTILYLHKDHNAILMSKNGDIVSLVKDGENRAPFAVFDLNSSTYSFDAFMEAFNTMNPRINITVSVLRNPKSLKEYDEAGALQTDLARMYTAGASYSIYPLDSNGKMKKPNNVANSVSWNKGNSEFKNENRAQVFYRGELYYYDKVANTFHESQSSPAITDTALLEELKYNMRIMNLTPTEQTPTTNIFVLNAGEHPEVVQVNRNSYKIKKLSEEEAKDYLAELKAKEEAKKRAEAAKEEVKKQIEEAPALDLGLEFDINPDTGEAEVTEQQEAKPEQKEKIEVEEEPSVEEQRSRETYENRSVENSSRYKATSATQTFKQLSKNKKYKSRVLDIVSKIPNSPLKFGDKGKILSGTTEEITEFLRGLNMEVDAIGTSETDIEAWIQTLENCR